MAYKNNQFTAIMKRLSNFWYVSGLPMNDHSGQCLRFTNILIGPLIISQKAFFHYAKRQYCDFNKHLELK